MFLRTGLLVDKQNEKWYNTIWQSNELWWLCNKSVNRKRVRISHNRHYCIWVKRVSHCKRRHLGKSVCTNALFSFISQETSRSFWAQQLVLMWCVFFRAMIKSSNRFMNAFVWTLWRFIALLQRTEPKPRMRGSSNSHLRNPSCLLATHETSSVWKNQTPMEWGSGNTTACSRFLLQDLSAPAASSCI